MTYTQLRRRMNRALHERNEAPCTTAWRKEYIRARYRLYTQGRVTAEQLKRRYP